MAKGTTLSELVHLLRVEARYDPNPALSSNVVPLMQQTIRRTQEFLYDEFDWPFLKVQRDIVLEAGSRFYDFPDDMNLERVLKVDVKHSSQWQAVHRGITLENYNTYDSEADARYDPAMAWDVLDRDGATQIEVWPIPASNGIPMRLTGIRNLTPLIESSDRCDLDATMIVLYAAGEMLGGANDVNGQLKLQQAKVRRDTLQGRATRTRTGSFSLGGMDPNTERMAERPILVAHSGGNS